jgi:hypothetical protein
MPIQRKFAIDFISAAKERGLVALQPIDSDECVLEEKPIVSAQYLYNRVRSIADAAPAADLLMVFDMTFRKWINQC